MSKKYTRIQSFKFAIDGLKSAFNDEPNLIIEMSIGFAVICLAAFLQISHLEWAILFLIIFLVISFELLNTALESFLDVVSPNKNPKVKKAKDTSAAVLLMISIASVLIGISIFLPKLVLLFL